MEKKLYRSSKNKVFSGVCGGLGDYFGIDPVIIRVIFVVTLFAIPPIAFFTYIVLAIILPKDYKIKEDIEITQEDERKEEKRSSPGAASVSIILAVILILTGIYFLVPNSFFRFWDFGTYLFALFLIFIAGKLGYDIIRDKDYSLTRLSMAFIVFTYGVFIILSRLNMINSGIYFEYAKNLIPAILILIGINIIFKNIKDKFPAAIIASLVLIFIACYSFVNGNYRPFGFMNKMMDGWQAPRMGNWWNRNRNINIRNFSNTFSMPAGIDNIVYSIENSAGNLDISDTLDLLEYRGEGIAPDMSTNVNNSAININFSNQASDTRLKLNNQKSVDLTLRVSAGSVEADLKNLSIRNLSLTVNGGAADIELGEKIDKMKVENNIGSTEIRLPRNALIRIKVESALAHLNIPDEFNQRDGEYVYEGGSNEISISAKVNMGNLEFHF